MPKGQYPRKPRAAPAVVEPTGGVVIGDTVHQPLAEKTFVEPDPMLVPVPERVISDERFHELTALAQSDSEIVPPSDVLEIVSLMHAAQQKREAITPGPSFDTWLDEDTSPIPANDRVSQVVQEWAAGFIPIEHSVTWLPAKDGKALSVLLTTAHGTSELVADAGAWTEADVSAALAVMRDELKV